MDDTPYTTPDEDPFNIQPLQPRRRRSSLLNKWIKDQQVHSPPPQQQPQPRITPYLAYPDLLLDNNTPREEALTLNSYDFIEDDDIPPTLLHELDLTSTPTTARSQRSSKLLHSPSSFRNFSLSFRSPSTAISGRSDGGSPRSSSRLSLFPRPPRHSTDAILAQSALHHHNRSSSLSTLNIPGKSAISSDIPSVATPPRWRPSVLGYFSTLATSQTSVAPSDTVYTPSRPSMSSGDTYTTATTTDCDSPVTPPRPSFMSSLRSRSRSHGSVFKAGSGIESSSSVSSQSRDADITYSSIHGIALHMASSSTSTLAHEARTTRIPLAPKIKSKLANSNINYDDESEDRDDTEMIVRPIKYDPTRPHIAYSSGGTLPRVSFGSLTSRQRKKKKLVVIGIALEDERKFEGVKRWCESFGEVSQITRMPNGELHVHFRLAEVADTVCRLRAKVYIAGVGSVQLSWYTGDKR